MLYDFSPLKFLRKEEHHDKEGGRPRRASASQIITMHKKHAYVVTRIARIASEILRNPYSSKAAKSAAEAALMKIRTRQRR